MCEGQIVKQFYIKIQAEQEQFFATVFFLLQMLYPDYLEWVRTKTAQVRSPNTAEIGRQKLLSRSFIYSHYKTLVIIVVASPGCSWSLWKYLYTVFVRSSLSHTSM